jgi:hypothetical protein
MSKGYDEKLLLAYIEGELGEEQRQAVEKAMAQDARLAQLIRAMISDRQKLRDLPEPATPPWLLDEVDRTLERSMLLDQSPAELEAVQYRQWSVMRRLALVGSMAAVFAVATFIVFRSLTVEQGSVEFASRDKADQREDVVAMDEELRSGKPAGADHETAPAERAAGGTREAGEEAAPEKSQIAVAEGAEAPASETEPIEVIMDALAEASMADEAEADDSQEPAAPTTASPDRGEIPTLATMEARRVETSEPTAPPAANLGGPVEIEQAPAALARDEDQADETVARSPRVVTNVAVAPEATLLGTDLVHQAQQLQREPNQWQLVVRTTQPQQSIEQLRQVVSEVPRSELRRVAAGVTSEDVTAGAQSADTQAAPMLQQKGRAMAVDRQALDEAPQTVVPSATTHREEDLLPIGEQAADPSPQYVLRIPADQAEQVLVRLARQEDAVAGQRLTLQRTALPDSVREGDEELAESGRDLAATWPSMAYDYSAPLAEQLPDRPVEQEAAGDEKGATVEPENEGAAIAEPAETETPTPEQDKPVESEAVIIELPVVIELSGDSSAEEAGAEAAGAVDPVEARAAETQPDDGEDEVDESSADESEPAPENAEAESTAKP